VIVPSNKIINLHKNEQFVRGEFEVQDEAAQITAQQVRCRPGDVVLSYCNDSGVSSLAIAHLLGGRGQLHLYDPKPLTLHFSKKRFQKAGITNVHFHGDEEELQRSLLSKADWILLDAPSTGTGTIRRNPEIKLQFTPTILRHYCHLQQQRFSRAIKYLKPNGRIVYITSSLVPQENENQVNSFANTFHLEAEGGQVLRTKTEVRGMDTMFAAVLKYKR
jgi:16S rRNA C967 or C1407 C5-methylase (RsmB/RsmF family)